MELPRINVLLLTFRLQAQESVMLPPFLGSTLRGAFGTALKKVFCFVPHGECERCWFFEACPYQYIFESPNLIPKEENHKLLQGQKEVPQPFVLIPPNPRPKGQKPKTQKGVVNFNEDYAENHFSRGAGFEFSILLMGKAALYWSQILVAVRLLAEYGLGKRRVPFVLAEAFAHDYHGQTLKIFSLENPKVSSYNVSAIPLAWIAGLRVQSLKNDLSETKSDRLKIELQTPTRIRIADEINPTITFFDLLKKLTERLEFLAFLHAETAQKIDYRPILRAAEGIFSIHSSLKTYRYEQFSNTQGGKTRRDVVLGETIFQGSSLVEFLPFLAVGELLNIGTNTSAGFGKFIIKL
jgi:hypothetical protein